MSNTKLELLYKELELVRDEMSVSLALGTVNFNLVARLDSVKSRIIAEQEYIIDTLMSTEDAQRKVA